MGALQDLFRRHGPGYLARFGQTMPGHQKKEIKARIELARGFDVPPPMPIELPKPQPLRCSHCGAKLRYRCTILPYAALRQRFAALIAHTVELSIRQALNAGP